LSLRVRDLRVACGLDWGHNSPGCVLWGAALPNEHVYVFDELKFQRMEVRDVAAAIKEKHREWGLKGTQTIYADPSLAGTTGQIGESYAQTFARHGVPLITKLSNHREQGWQRVHEALAPCKHPMCTSDVYPDGIPWLTFHSRCRYLIRTMPLMVQSDKANKQEDLDTESDDHACDALRYMLQGGLRPRTIKHVERESPNSLRAWRRLANPQPVGALA
jgi:hypothetical protein